MRGLSQLAYLDGNDTVAVCRLVSALHSCNTSFRTLQGSADEKMLLISVADTVMAAMYAGSATSSAVLNRSPPILTARVAPLRNNPDILTLVILAASSRMNPSKVLSLSGSNQHGCGLWRKMRPTVICMD